MGNGALWPKTTQPRTKEAGAEEGDPGHWPKNFHPQKVSCTGGSNFDIVNKKVIAPSWSPIPYSTAFASSSSSSSVAHAFLIKKVIGNTPRQLKATKS